MGENMKSLLDVLGLSWSKTYLSISEDRAVDEKDKCRLELKGQRIWHTCWCIRQHWIQETNGLYKICHDDSNILLSSISDIEDTDIGASTIYDIDNCVVSILFYVDPNTTSEVVGSADYYTGSSNWCLEETFVCEVPIEFYDKDVIISGSGGGDSESHIY